MKAPKIRGCCGTVAQPATPHKDGCPHEKTRLAVREAYARHRREGPRGKGNDFNPDWTVGCEVCDAKPIVPATGMCGPCTFGEAETIGGNW